MFAQTFDAWCDIVSGRLAGYCGRTLADLPDGLIPLLAWVYERGHDANALADSLADVNWGARCVLVERRGIA